MDRTATCRRLAVVAAGLMLTVGLPLVRGQKPADAPPAGPSTKAPEQPAWAKLTADSIKPLPLESIPDSPPPHEGQMFELSERIEPPDLVIVEVLEAWPGRPITGERLVRPDGTISLHWYGEIHVAGLTPKQAKVKLILHIRKFLNDQTLGLIAWDENPGKLNGNGAIAADPLPSLPRPDAAEFQDLDAVMLRLQRGGTEPPKSPGINDAAEKKVGPSAPTEKAKDGDAPDRRPFPDANTARPLREPKAARTADGAVHPKPDLEDLVRPVAPGGAANTPRYVYVDPAESLRVFVDISAYNSKVYYVQGDVGSPGRLPSTGKDTVLDTITFAGQLLPSADRKNIRLNRPARGDKPQRSYRIDLDAIERGEAKANLQIFPGDRLIIGRKGDPQAPLQ